MASVCVEVDSDEPQVQLGNPGVNFNVFSISWPVGLEKRKRRKQCPVPSPSGIGPDVLYALVLTLTRSIIVFRNQLVFRIPGVECSWVSAGFPCGFAVYQRRFVVNVPSPSSSYLHIGNHTECPLTTKIWYHRKRPLVIRY